jgi:hypothetical protein
MVPYLRAFQLLVVCVCLAFHLAVVRGARIGLLLDMLNLGDDLVHAAHVRTADGALCESAVAARGLEANNFAARAGAARARAAAALGMEDADRVSKVVAERLAQNRGLAARVEPREPTRRPDTNPTDCARKARNFPRARKYQGARRARRTDAACWCCVPMFIWVAVATTQSLHFLHLLCIIGEVEHGLGLIGSLLGMRQERCDLTNVTVLTKDVCVILLRLLELLNGLGRLLRGKLFFAQLGFLGCVLGQFALGCVLGPGLGSRGDSGRH